MFFTAVYTVGDEWYHAEEAALVRRRPSVKPTFPDRERGGSWATWRGRPTKATGLLRWWPTCALFPPLLERSVLHKRPRRLGLLLDHCRCAVRHRLLAPDDPRWLLDGCPCRCVKSAVSAARREQRGAPAACLGATSGAVPCGPGG
jgi:hypothetical protein